MSTLSDKFGLSKDQVRDTLDFLESNSKVIKRHYRTIDGRTGKLSNVMYIELIPTVLMNLTYLDSADGGNIPESTEISSTSHLEKSEEILENLPTPTRENSNTYTKNTPKNTKANNTETTTTKATCTVVYSESALFWCREAYPDFSDEALISFLNAANGSVPKVIDSCSVYKKQKDKIKHPESWIIACIKGNYYENKSNKPTKKTDHGFKGRDYD